MAAAIKAQRLVCAQPAGAEDTCQPEYPSIDAQANEASPCVALLQLNSPLLALPRALYFPFLASHLAAAFSQANLCGPVGRAGRSVQTLLAPLDHARRVPPAGPLKQQKN